MCVTYSGALPARHATRHTRQPDVAGGNVVLAGGGETWRDLLAYEQRNMVMANGRNVMALNGGNGAAITYRVTMCMRNSYQQQCGIANMRQHQWRRKRNGM